VRWQFSASGSLAQAHLTVDAGVVYAQLYAEPAEAYTLVALAAGDGHRLWSYPGGQDPAAFTAAGSTVYVAWSPSQPGTSAPCGCEWDALAGASGAVVWHVTRPGDDQPRQLLLKGGVLYSAGQSLSALRASDGAVLWQAATAISPGGNAEPVVGDGALYYAADLGTIHALSLSDGHELWQRHVDNSALMLALAPGRLVVATQSKLVYALRAADGSLAWQQPADTFNSILGPAFGFVVAGGVAYVGTDHGVVQALRADDGAVLWRFAVAPKPALTEPVYSAYVQFRAGTTYAQALRAVTDLGLRVSGHPCVSPGTWQPVNWSDTWQDSAGAFLVAATPISRPDWLDALKQSAGAADAQADPVFHCPALGFDPNAIPGLPQGQEGTPVRVTFATGTSYDAALAAVTRLGFRLANPCYERQPQGAPVEWSPVGQEAVFASTGALLVATTPSNAATWQQQIRQAGGVASVAVSPPLTCP
jgi:outer membrane protein assembly factor BamB